MEESTNAKTIRQLIEEHNMRKENKQSSLSTPSSAHIITTPPAYESVVSQPQLFTQQILIQPTVYRPIYDIEGDFGHLKTGYSGAPTPVRIKQNGQYTTMYMAYWTPVYPGWVAVSGHNPYEGEQNAEKMRSHGFRVLEVECSHDARHHHGGSESQCSPEAKMYRPCANLHDNPKMQNQYGKEYLKKNWEAYKSSVQNRENRDTLSLIEMRIQTNRETAYLGALAQNMMANSVPTYSKLTYTETKEPKGKGKKSNSNSDSLGGIMREIQASQYGLVPQSRIGFMPQLSGQLMAHSLATRDMTMMGGGFCVNGICYPSNPF
jgi:hypothetical protein